MALKGSSQGIVPVKISLTKGDFYTLWAPRWVEHGAEWQAFLGAGEHVYFFESPAALLAYLRSAEKSGEKHDLVSHPKWNVFSSKDITRVIPGDRDTYDIIGVPAMLAGRSSHDNVSGVSRGFAMVRSLADVNDITNIQSFFAAHSVLGNVDRGSDHYNSDTGRGEWTAVGRNVYNKWDSVVDALDEVVYLPEVDADAVALAQTDLDEEVAKQKADREAAEKAAAEAEAQVDPYDQSLWAAAGIDPIKIAIDGRILYTLRTYVGGVPVFLGKYGEIFTFNNPKALIRWLIEHDDHDLAKVSTWQDIMDGVNAGDLTIQVHKDNQYSFTGLAADISKGPKVVDTDQMRQAYELLADAADWAADDSLNSILLADPGLQDYISYMLGSKSGYVPSAPYTDEANGWKKLEESLTGRFSKL